MTSFYTLSWRDGALSLIDQRRLPLETTYLDYTNYVEVAQAIREMVVRGAPAIGAAAGYALALVPWHDRSGDPRRVRAELAHAAEVLIQARPTAINLTWATERMLKRLADLRLESCQDLRTAALSEAHAIADEDLQTNLAIARHAQPLVPDPAVIVHHCNTGALATVAYGTALGIIRMAHEQGKRVFVLVDETRPRLQGARLTAWELQQYGIPFKVIADGASGHYMRTSHVDLCTVGCDRVAANGDTANKIGTYNLALVAHAHGVPFYVACPTSTIDWSCPNGEAIPIEERLARELTHVGEQQITPDGVQVGNPAFDVTPAEYITAIVTEKGVAKAPYLESLAWL